MLDNTFFEGAEADNFPAPILILALYPNPSLATRVTMCVLVCHSRLTNVLIEEHSLPPLLLSLALLNCPDHSPYPT